MSRKQRATQHKSQSEFSMIINQGIKKTKKDSKSHKFYVALTFTLDEELDEALLIVSLRNDVDQDVVLLPHAIDLVVLVLNDGTLAMIGSAVLNELLLSDVVSVRIGERRPQVVQHLFFCDDLTYAL